MLDPAADLAAHHAALYDEPEGDDQASGPDHRINDDRHATWAQRRLAQHRAELDRISHVAADEIAEINRWAEEASRPVEAKAARLNGMLGDYLRRLINEELDPLLEDGVELETAWGRVKTKGHSLPGGRLQARIIPSSPSIVDEEGFVAWALEQAPHLVRHRPATAELKATVVIQHGKVLTPEGEVVPGVVVEPARITYRS